MVIADQGNDDTPLHVALKPDAPEPAYPASHTSHDADPVDAVVYPDTAQLEQAISVPPELYLPTAQFWQALPSKYWPAKQLCAHTREICERHTTKSKNSIP